MAEQVAVDDRVDEDGERGFKPPYLSFVTFTNFLDKFGENPPPPRIDKSYLSSHSGANQAMILSTLRSFGLIDDDGTVLPELVKIATDQDARKRFLNERLRDLYQGAVELGEQNATSKQLDDWFSQFKYQGSTLRKAVLFYLNAAEYAGVPTSPHFKAPRVTGGGSRRRSTKQGRSRSRGTASRDGSQAGGESGGTSGPGEQITVTLGEAGTVTLTVDVRWLDLPDDTFSGLRQLTKDLRALAEDFDDAQPDDVGEEED